MDSALIAIHDQIKFLEKYNRYKKEYDEALKNVEQLKRLINEKNKLKEEQKLSFLRSKNITMDEYKQMDPIIAKTIIPNDLMNIEDIRKEPYQSKYINLLNLIYNYQQKLKEMTITEDDTFEKLKEKEIKILEELTGV